ncbi:hypothetical protein [Streptomyces sp. NPDC056987]|uniref:hypothetical protein n=1 Tax=Streptomyces sp. NPDC056987 TaxID=3345988 RepID=UPI0036284D14
MTGNFLRAGGISDLVRQSFPGPWSSLPPYESVLPWIGSVLINLAVAGTYLTTVAGAVVLWAYPTLLLLWRPRTAGLRSTALDELTSAFQVVFLWWLTVALWAGVVGTAAVVAATVLSRWPRANGASLPAGSVRRSWPDRAVVAATAMAGLVLTAAVVDSQRDSGSPFSAVPVRPEPVDTDDKVRDFQLLAWFKVSGQADIVALSGRYVELALWVQNLNAENGTGDADTLRPVCAGLARDTATARRHLRVPDPDLDQKWSTLLNRSRSAAAECKAVLNRHPGGDAVLSGTGRTNAPGKVFLAGSPWSSGAIV